MHNGEFELVGDDSPSGGTGQTDSLGRYIYPAGTGTNPTNEDKNGDSVADGWDTDGDGLSDGATIKTNKSPAI